MVSATPDDVEKTYILLGVLDSVERDGGRSQRHIAAELGIALGLVNAYLKRCVKKGLVKVGEAPARRYAYYLTPQGFAEKSRLTVEYLSHSFGFFRQAKADCSSQFQLAKSRGVTRMVFAGRSDLAEIAALCAPEHGVQVLGVVQEGVQAGHFGGLPLFDNFDSLQVPFDGVLVTGLVDAPAICKAAVDRFGVDRVFVPQLLRIRIAEATDARP